MRPSRRPWGQFRSELRAQGPEYGSNTKESLFRGVKKNIPRVQNVGFKPATAGLIPMRPDRGEIMSRQTKGPVCRPFVRPYTRCVTVAPSCGGGGRLGALSCRHRRRGHLLRLCQHHLLHGRLQNPILFRKKQMRWNEGKRSGTSRPVRGQVPLDVLVGHDRAGHAHIPAILAEDQRTREIFVCIALSEYSRHTEDICKDSDLVRNPLQW